MILTLFFNLQIHELRDSLDGAVAVKNFLRANQFKEQIKVVEAEKEELLNSLESSDLETLKRYAAFKSSLKKVAAAGVAGLVLLQFSGSPCNNLFFLAPISEETSFLTTFYGLYFSHHYAHITYYKLWAQARM